MKSEVLSCLSAVQESVWMSETEKDREEPRPSFFRSESVCRQLRPVL